MLLSISASGAEWRLVHQDNFERKALGTDWLVLRGDWHINKDGQLQIQRQWQSHSWIMSTLPLRGRNVRVEFDLCVPSRLLGFIPVVSHPRGPLDDSTFEAHLQGGALGWGGGGIDDRVGVKIHALPPEKRTEAGGRNGYQLIDLDRWYTVSLQLADGRFELGIDNKIVERGRVHQGRSLINSNLQMAAAPCAVVDNLRVYACPMARPLPRLNDAPASENRRATVDAGGFLDRSKPDCGFQAAIDSLPPGGGAVNLPEGRFLMRRHLRIPSHTTLKGQGPSTVLKAMDVTGAEVESWSSDGGVIKLRLKAPHDFRRGDAFAYGSSWGHGGKPDDVAMKRGLVLAEDGNTLTVNCPPQSKGTRIIHFFALVCSFGSEFAEVKDLALEGPTNNPSGASGGFSTCPVTFGSTSNPRFTRVVIRSYPSDGLSAQTCDDGRAFDVTVSGCSQGLHPGTTTLRFMAARTVAVHNRSTGLYFCWYNSNGIYYRNRLKNFTGYPDQGDVFNTLAFNSLTDRMGVSIGYNGCIFGNRAPGLTLGAWTPREPMDESRLGPGLNKYSNMPRYFSVACNVMESFTASRFTRGNVVADNSTSTGKPTPYRFLIAADTEDKNPERDKNVWSDRVLAGPIEHLPPLPDRREPVPPPELPAPVLDGATYYNPRRADCGFQQALDELRDNGGALRLPGGRYVLQEPLRIPSNVRLAGHGAGTILLAGEGVGNVVTAEDAENVVLREFVVEGSWPLEKSRAAAAVAVSGGGSVSLIALDLRGWGGDAVQIRQVRGVAVQDCRVLRCPGDAYRVENASGLRMECNSAVQCGSGFRIIGSRDARLFANLSALNGGAGFTIRSNGAVLSANNAHNNLQDGFLLEDCRGTVLAGNTVNGNNQSGKAYAGVRLAKGATKARVLFNNCGDEQLCATQLVGILEEKGASGNELIGNITATVATRRGHERAPSLVAKGENSRVERNWTETLLPSNDSIETIEWKRRQAAQDKER
jgi:parallel beta-helix repeat protein